jgi:hypothetical protein
VASAASRSATGSSGIFGFNSCKVSRIDGDDATAVTAGHGW